MVYVLRMLGKGLLLKTTTLLVFFLWLDFEYDFRSSRLTADFLMVASDRIARAFNRIVAS